MWIQALTFFRDLDGVAGEAEDFLQRALVIIGEKKILSPLLVLEIVQARKNIKFKVLRKYLLDRLKAQDEVIKKSKKKVDENVEQIKKMTEEMAELRTTAKTFGQKECTLCKQKLVLPTIHFLCGHTFHDNCVESETNSQQPRRCPKCASEFQEVLDTRAQLQDQARAGSEQFVNELKQSQVKFEVIATYFGRGLFGELTQHIRQQNEK